MQNNLPKNIEIVDPKTVDKIYQSSVDSFEVSLFNKKQYLSPNFRLETIQLTQPTVNANVYANKLIKVEITQSQFLHSIYVDFDVVYTDSGSGCTVLISNPIDEVTFYINNNYLSRITHKAMKIRYWYASIDDKIDKYDLNNLFDVSTTFTAAASTTIHYTVELEFGQKNILNDALMFSPASQLFAHITMFSDQTQHVSGSGLDGTATMANFNGYITRRIYNKESQLMIEKSIHASLPVIFEDILDFNELAFTSSSSGTVSSLVLPLNNNDELNLNLFAFYITLASEPSFSNLASFSFQRMTQTVNGSTINTLFSIYDINKNNSERKLKNNSNIIQNVVLYSPNYNINAIENVGKSDPFLMKSNENHSINIYNIEGLSNSTAYVLHGLRFCVRGVKFY